MDSSPNLYIASPEIDDRIDNHFRGLSAGSTVSVALRDVTDADMFGVRPLRSGLLPEHEVYTLGVMIVCPNYVPGCTLGLEQERQIIAELHPAVPHGYHYKLNLLDGVEQDRIQPVFASA